MYGVARFVMESGERSCLVIDRSSGLPLFYPNLYLTTQLRNRSVAFATIESEASHLVSFYRYLDDRDIDINERFLRKHFFKDFELDDLRDFTQKKLRKVSIEAAPQPVIPIMGRIELNDRVSNGTHYARLTSIANYLNWFAKHLLDRAEQIVVKQIDLMCSQIKARRPVRKGRGIARRDKSLSEEQIEILLEVIRPGSELNPFKEEVQTRNCLLILLLVHLGVRGGELLNIQVRDFDAGKNQLRIIRRADEKNDSRVNAPNTKTLGRILPLGDLLAKRLHDYIVHDRSKVPNARRHEYLFVTHKEGPTQGQPISKASYNKIISVVRQVSPELHLMTGHMLRHTWNRRFSEVMDSMEIPENEARQEQIRSFLMGWKEGSGTAAVYNRRFAEKKAQEAALQMQSNNGTRLPKV